MLVKLVPAAAAAAIEGHEVVKAAALLAEALQPAVLEHLGQLDVDLANAVAVVVLLVGSQVPPTTSNLAHHPVAGLVRRRWVADAHHALQAAGEQTRQVMLPHSPHRRHSRGRCFVCCIQAPTIPFQVAHVHGQERGRLELLLHMLKMVVVVLLWSVQRAGYASLALPLCRHTRCISCGMAACCAVTTLPVWGTHGTSC